MSYRGQYGDVKLEDSNDVHGKIFVRPETDDDMGVDEIWRENVYRMHPDYVRGRTVLDIGANIGAFSVWASQAGAKKVIAYEPEPSNFIQLQQNTKHLKGVECRQVAVGGADGMIHIAVPGEAYGSGMVKPGGSIQMIDFNTVLSEFVDVAVLKMDIEGGEYDCFEGMHEDSLNSVQRLVMEVHGPGMTLDLDPGWKDKFGVMVYKIANWGHVDLLGRPDIGGMLYGIRY